MVWKLEANHDGRFVIWQGADDVLANPAADWDRVSFHSDLHYPAASTFVSENVTLPNAPNATTLPTRYQKYSLYSHGVAGRPTVFAVLRGLALAGGADVPLLGTVPVQTNAANSPIIRWVTLMVTAGEIALWEICPGYGSTPIMSALPLTVDMYIFDRLMEEDPPPKDSVVLEWSPTRFVASGGRFDSEKRYIRKTTTNAGSYLLNSGCTIQSLYNGNVNVQFRNGQGYAVNCRNNIAFTVDSQRVAIE